MIEGAIFDCDGVLVDSEPISNAAMQRSLARYGLQLDLSEVMRLFVGSPMDGVAEKARELGANLPEHWISEIYEETYEALRKGVAIIPGVLDVLDALDAQGRPYAVASNGSIEKMKITLGQTGLWSRFEGRMLSAHEEGVAKPDPDLFLRAAARINYSPQNCIVIEDSTTGAIAARRAGMRCIGYAPDGNTRLEAEGAIIARTMEHVAKELRL